MKIKSLVLSLSLVMVVLNGCSESKPTSESGACIPAAQLDGIVNGRTLSPSDALSKKVAMILTAGEKAGTMEVCTGTPIGKDLILTAAHCVENASSSQVVVAFHTDVTCESGFNAKDSDRVIKAKGLSVKSDYSSVKITNDLALIKLEKEIPADYEVSELYDGVEALSSDEIILTGYGRTSELKNDSMFLRTTSKSQSLDTKINGAELTWAQSTTGVCQGDSGGPVFFQVQGKLKVAGVVSSVSGTSEETVCHGRGRSMYVPYFIKWIQETQNSLNY